MPYILIFFEMSLLKFRQYCALRRVKYFLWLKDIFVDFYAWAFYKQSLKKLQATNTPKILFFNSGHLGDALIMSYCLPTIKEKYPNAQIDVVCGDWCKFVFTENPLVRKVIVQNHFMTNRSAISDFEKFKIHLKTAFLAQKELKKEIYDYAFDVRYSGAVMLWLLPFIKVKNAFGFGTRGFGGLLSKEFFLPNEEFHVYEMIALLLKEIGVETSVLNVKPYLPFKSASVESVKQKVGISSNTILIFPESGAEIRMMSVEFWVELCGKLLSKSKFDLMLCGEKEFTKNLYKELQNQLVNFQNRIAFAGKLTLSEVATLPQIANAAITLESFPAHLCSIYTKTVILGKEGSGFQFFPINNNPVLMFHNHSYSKDLKLERSNLTCKFVENFEENSIKDEIVEFLIAE